ncbi:MarR family winged helix-turn-helix transcriptional regulator [Peribacillus frigoritolerans]|nr:MarR family winged helix-turn-helix transcriptional regulator [Peribacillus frigoritolerans]
MTNPTQLFHQYLQVSRSLVSKMNEQITALEIYHNQWTILNYLKNCGYSTIPDICSYLDVDSVIITRSVNSMEQNNMIKQVPGKDEQEKRIELTPGAKRYIQNVLKLQKKSKEKPWKALLKKNRKYFSRLSLKSLII